MPNAAPPHIETVDGCAIEIIQGQRGWIARLQGRGLAARGQTEEEAVERVRSTAELVDKLAQRWTGGELEPAPF